MMAGEDSTESPVETDHCRSGSSFRSGPSCWPVCAGLPPDIATTLDAAATVVAAVGSGVLVAAVVGDGVAVGAGGVLVDVGACVSVGLAVAVLVGEGVLVTVGVSV